MWSGKTKTMVLIVDGEKVVGIDRMDRDGYWKKKVGCCGWSRRLGAREQGAILGAILSSLGKLSGPFFSLFVTPSCLEGTNASSTNSSGGKIECCKD